MSLLRTSSTTTEAISTDITSAGQFSAINPPEAGIIYTNNTAGSITTTYPTSQTWAAGQSLAFGGSTFVTTGGASADTVQTITTTGNITAYSSTVLVDATAGNIIVTLPTSVGNIGKSVRIYRIDGTANTVNISAFGAELTQFSNQQNELKFGTGCLTMTVVANNIIRQTSNIGLVNRTVQQFNATGTINYWNSIVEIGATPLTANITLTLPSCNGAIGKDLRIKRLDNTAFTVTLVPVAGDTTEITTPAIINKQFGALTLACVSNTKSEQVSNIGSVINSAYTQGQVVGLNQTLTADIGDLIYCNGRLKSSLTPAQQIVATALGYGTNIPDYRGKIPVGADGTTYVVNTAGGSSALTIAQANLPNVNLSGGSHSHTATDSGHSHTTNINNSTFNGSANGGERFLNNGGITLNGNITSGFGSTASTANITVTASGALSIPLGGSGTALTNRPADLPTQYFVWLGASNPAVTVIQPLSLTTTGSGASTFNSGTGVLNIPAPSTITPIVQTFTASGTYTPTVGLKYAIVKAVGGGGAGGGAAGSPGITSSNYGAGGNSGTYVEVLLTTAQIGVSQGVTIGTGGTGTTTTGGAGNATTLGALFSASGGAGGTTSSSNSNFTGGLLGVSTSSAESLPTITTGLDLGSAPTTLGTIAIFGANASFSGVTTGSGGASRLGAGGRGSYTNVGAGNNGGLSSQSASVNTGGGGSGAWTFGATAAAQNGGNGGSGKMIITEYF